EKLGLGADGRHTIQNWEEGLRVPRPQIKNSRSTRAVMLDYLWNFLRMHDNPIVFEALWWVLVEEWDWEELSDTEWKALTPLPRPEQVAVGAMCIKLEQVIDHLKTGQEKEAQKAWDELLKAKITPVGQPKPTEPSPLLDNPNVYYARARE